MQKLKLSILSVPVFLCTCCVSPIIQQNQTYYIAGVSDLGNLIPSSPQPGSPAEKNDLKELHKWQNDRTKENCSRAKTEARASFFNLFGEVSPFPSPLPLPVADFFKRVKLDTDTAGSPVKMRHKRPRPFVLDPTLSPCLENISGFAYPSGHASTARVFAEILSSLVPKDRMKFMTRADDIAMNRVVAGAHYPSDIEAGKALGEAIFREMQKNSVFRAELAELQQYLSAYDPTLLDSH